MKQDNRNIELDLMESAVRIIAREGFDKASIRNISGDCELPNSYIYVHFKDKYDLYDRSFRNTDTALAEEVGKHLFILDQKGLTNEERLYYIYVSIYMYLISDPDICSFYLQYYYSPIYRKYSVQEHTDLWFPIVEDMKALFRPGTDVTNMLRTVFTMMLDQVAGSISEHSVNEDMIIQKNYELVLGMVREYLLDDQFS